MGHRVTTARSDLEQMLLDETAEPKALPLSLLEDITGGFSRDKQIGSGGFAVVYKGILGDRAVAVKRLTNPLMDETEFHREVECLMRVKHKNIVRFLGYCADRQGTMERYKGKLVMADVHQRLLCFEYIPKGSLHNYIIDAYREWGTCYEIIKGICEGIRYLHENNIIHLDLKPANILLDDVMIPKITDFGLSRCFDENQSRHITKKVAGTPGYIAPEYIKGHVIARSCDLYSLGAIIIEILTGHIGYEDIEDVLESWSDRLERSERHTLCEQIKVCYEIALECIDYNPKKRPTSARDIIDRLHEMESIQTAGATSSTSGVAVAKSNGKSNTDNPRVYHFVPAPGRGAHPLAGQTVSMMRPAGPASTVSVAPGSAYGLLETKTSFPGKADESFGKTWLSEARSHFHDNPTKTRFNLIYSPKLMYLKVVAISAHDLLPAEEGRSLAPTIAKIQLGEQVRRTRPGQPQGSANVTWNKEFMFVASEPLENPLVVTVEECVGPGRDEPIGGLIIHGDDVPRHDLAKSVPSKWFSLSRGVTVDEAASRNGESSKTFASKIHLRLSLETEYHVLT